MLTWGCNAIHRDGHGDNIVSIDYGIQQEIYESGYHKWSQCWFADWNPVPAEILSTMFMGFDIPDTYIHRTKKNGHQGEQCIIAGTDPATLHEKVEAAIKQFPHLDMEDLKIKMTKEIVKSTSLPVTVKTRLGWDENSKYIVEVAERLQDVGIKAISIHGRTRKQMYKGEADWTLIREVKNNPRMHIPVFGNGDISSGEKALEMKKKYGIDGVMIGRAAIGYPWIFNEIKSYLNLLTRLLKANF